MRFKINSMLSSSAHLSLNHDANFSCFIFSEQMLKDMFLSVILFLFGPLTFPILIKILQSEILLRQLIIDTSLTASLSRPFA